MVFPFINRTGNSKVSFSFQFGANEMANGSANGQKIEDTIYDCVLYFLPIVGPEAEADRIKREIVQYFGNRMYKGKSCLDITPQDIELNIDTNNISAYILVQPQGIDNVASAALQVYNWCYPQRNRQKADFSKADIWITDVCRILGANATTTNIGTNANPLNAMFFLMEQLAIQNLGKNTIKLYVDTEPASNLTFLRDKYQTLGFQLATNNCPSWNDDHAVVMEKNGLTSKANIVNLSFLKRRTHLGGNSRYSCRSNRANRNNSRSKRSSQSKSKRSSQSSRSKKVRGVRLRDKVRG